MIDDKIQIKMELSTIWLFIHEEKNASDIKQKNFIRQKYSKLVHFKHQ